MAIGHFVMAFENSFFLALFLGFGVVLGGEVRRVDAMPDAPPAPIDVHSHSQPAVVAVRHVDLNLRVDFAARSLRSFVAARRSRPTANGATSCLPHRGDLRV